MRNLLAFDLGASNGRAILGQFDGEKITMQERIKRLAMKYCEKGEISTSDYAVIKEMHDIYHNDLGGNGFLTAVMDDVENLPRIR